MQLLIDFKIDKCEDLIEPHHKILLLGSCFTEHMGMRLEKWGWHIFQNPTGVIYNPHSVCVAIDRLIEQRLVTEDEMILHNGVYNHWDFHSRFSHIDRQVAAEQMNLSLTQAHEFLAHCDWLFLTWGSSHYYTYNESDYQVSNCHRIPNKNFSKSMYAIDDMCDELKLTFQKLKAFNPKIKICQTVSPVRHIKDGVIENSLSKSRLIEMSHRLIDSGVHYFPSYEILIDELRDYRFYDTDLVHPNYAATQYVWEKYVHTFFSDRSHEFLAEMIEIYDAYNHKPRFPETESHQKFLKKYLLKCQDLEVKYPHLQLKKYSERFAREV